MREIDNFRLFEERKFKKQLGYLTREANQKTLAQVNPLEKINKEWVFIKILQIKRTEKTRIVLLIEDLTTAKQVTYVKKDETDIPFIETAYYNVTLTQKVRYWKKQLVLVDYKPVGYFNQLKIVNGEPLYGALLSDIHVGSIYFMKKEFIRFLKYVETNKLIKYIFIAGDLIDGVGIYPEQEKNLYEKNAYLQYDQVKRLFETHLLREDIKVFFSPGNHDFLSLFEPQIVSPEIRKRLPDTWIILDNPDYITIEDKRILFYHGRSIDSLIMAKTPYLSYQKMTRVYDYMFSQRNLSPTVKGSRLDFRRSTGMIDQIPDIFLSGHVHKWCSSLQNGVLFCNSGCWQHETEYQKNLDITPVKGICQLINIRDTRGAHYKVDFRNQEIVEDKYTLVPNNQQDLE